MPSSPSPTEHPRELPAEAQDARWRRGIKYIWGLAALAALAWFLIVGHHRHLLEISSQHGTVRIVSHRSPIRVFLPGKEHLMPAVQFDLGFSDWHVQGADDIVPQHYNGVGIIHSTETVKLRKQTQAKVFLVNGIEFTLDGQEIRAAGQRWPLRPDEVVEINVDQLRP
jgi:hypothetical protein